MIARVIGIAVVVGIVACCRAGADEAKDGPRDLKVIEPNTWVAARPKYVLPKDVKDARWQTTDGYCGSTYRSKAGTIISRTGVRSKSAGFGPGFYSNATLEEDLAANVAAGDVSQSFQLNDSILNSPWGTMRGAIWAWNVAKGDGRQIGQAVAL
ncbi:hypothetical protein LCGC14_1598590 [marine sediment metagenome]|uniref:Uncharacterized protein n=1 Tax=marine sediment metagenome TaxID=412755 RepID=A0A0F9LC11_9ZZZZ